MNDTQTCSNLFGQRITVFRNDHVGDKIAAHGLYEKENLQLLLSLLQQLEHPVVLDIGANIGNHTLAFATVAASVHAFEPVPHIHALLRRNVEQNQLTNVCLHPIALSDSDGEATIHMVKAGNFGASGFDQRGNDTEPVQVTKRRGDALLAELGVAHVDLLKIDVEAHEIYVLRGLMETLRRDLPFITMEWNDPLTIERLSGSEELAFLQDNYRILVLGSSWDRAWWHGRPLAFLRRKCARLFGTRRAVLYDFDAARLYKNLLLVPKHRLDVLAQLQDKA